MYAMLTGTLPFTVEPFSLRALHQKMVDKEMNPLPPSLSTGTGRVKDVSLANKKKSLIGYKYQCYCQQRLCFVSREAVFTILMKNCFVFLA